MSTYDTGGYQNTEAFAPNGTTAAGDTGAEQRRRSSIMLSPQELSEIAASASGQKLLDKLARSKQQLQQEKQGKRKLFHALVKLAEQVKQMKLESRPIMERHHYANQTWYEGGMWRAPQVLPGVGGDQATAPPHPSSRVRMREAISLSHLFFVLVCVTAFSRVGVAVSTDKQLSVSSFCYFAVFWTIWSKEVSYSTRFDMTDLSATTETLLTCFAVLFGSLSCNKPITSVDGTRIMMVAAFVAFMHCLLHIRVAMWYSSGSSNGSGGGEQSLDEHVRRYAIFTASMTSIETFVWMIGILFTPVEWEHRWLIFALGLLLALRVPRAFLANDFHAACSKRSVIFILLLGFLLQSVVIVAAGFFEYQTPNFEQYSFIGAACLMLFCIKLLYVDDSAGLAEDHALLVNRSAAFFFNMGQFCLLLSTTVMGSGLSLLTHSYLAAAAALPDNGKNLVCGGYSAVLLSIFFIKSMHLRRIPTDPQHQSIFIGAYVIQTVVLLSVVGVTAAMCMGHGGYFRVLMERDSELLFVLSGFAFLLVVIQWLDEGVELNLYQEDSRTVMVHPFGFWWCLQPDVTEDELLPTSTSQRSLRLSTLSPLLGSSAADLKSSSRLDLNNYASIVAEHDAAAAAAAVAADEERNIV